MTRSLASLQAQFAAMLDSPLAPPCRAAIYHNNRRANFSRALALAYPVTERIVGRDFFVRLALDYMQREPSRSGDLHHAGEGFASFLASGFAAPDGGYEYLADLARLEWAWQCALIAADAPVLRVDALAALPSQVWARLRFTLQPALGLIDSKWPIHTLFTEHRSDEPRIVRLDSGAECVCVLRRGITVEAHRLDAGEYALWAALRAGHTLEAALAASEPADLGGALGRLFALGAVAAVADSEAVA